MNNDCKRLNGADEAGGHAGEGAVSDSEPGASGGQAGPVGIFSDARFEDMGLDPALLKGVREAGFERCTPIQAQALPLALAGRDVAGQARTGTGKTAAFLIASMHQVLRSGAAAEAASGPSHGPGGGNDAAPGGAPPGPRCRPRILVVAPTRELAIQIHKDAETLGGHTGLVMGVVYGGTGYERQRRMIEEGLDVLIGTPGRLIDYHRQRLYDLRSVEAFVLDEADRMFDLGFIRDIRYLCRRLRPPAKRLSFLFSATLSQRVLELAYEHMNNATLIDTRPPDRVVVDEVTQRLFHVGQEEKIPLLLGLLRRPEVERAIVFVNTRQMADRLGSVLDGNGYLAAVLSGGRSPEAPAGPAGAVPPRRHILPGRDGRGRPRSPHPGGDPRLQLRSPPRFGGLRAPDRTHRAGGGRRARRSASPASATSTP